MSKNDYIFTSFMSLRDQRGRKEKDFNLTGQNRTDEVTHMIDSVRLIASWDYSVNGEQVCFDTEKSSVLFALVQLLL